MSKSFSFRKVRLVTFHAFQYMQLLLGLILSIILLSFLSGNVEKNLPLTFIAAASGGGAFVLIIVAVICFAFVVRGRR